MDIREEFFQAGDDVERYNYQLNCNHYALKTTYNLINTYLSEVPENDDRNKKA